MFIEKKLDTRNEKLREMAVSVKHTLADETDVVAGLSMASAIINVYLDDINWAGFYIMRGGELVVGPFQGLPACVRIALGRGVCGTAAKERRAIAVRDVNDFPGHIACDSRSNSEIVLPIFSNGELFGVLDIDSPSVGRFGEEEVKYLQMAADDISGFVSRNI